jgi:hypothetical protein
MIRLKRKIALWSAGLGTSVVALFGAAAARAQDYTASTTAAIQDAGESVLSMFFTNLPVILVFVVAIVVTLWGIRWVMAQLKGGRR